MDANISATPSNLENIQRKAHFTGTVIKTTLAGAIVDIGMGIPGVVHISQLQKEPVRRVEDVVKEGESVEVWVRRVYPAKNRIELTMIKPLDLEWREIKKDMVVKGKVTRLEKFGAFVDIGAERPGLVHVSEMTYDYIKDPSEVVKEGDDIDVKVLGINRQKKQIKLSMKALEEPPVKVVKAAQKENSKETEEETKEEPVPTAMEFALRQAMDSAKSREDIPEAKSRKKPGSKNDLEKILARTLEHKIHTGK